MPPNLAFDNRFARLPKNFYTRLQPEGFSKHPFLVHGNARAASLIGLDASVFQDKNFIDFFSGKKIPDGAEPLASIYAGHQFGYFVPQLGDGRALLLGQIRDDQNQLWDIQLKGAGQTPYSRFADGRAVMRSTIREYLCSEAMAALDIPTTRALCMVGTNEMVRREVMEPGAILTRVAQSHIRFGHFEFFYHSDQHEEVRILADHIIENYFPEFIDRQDKYKAWFAEIVACTARLMARWQAVGFAHGVMNTDNMSILGLTIDYGPFGFVENFDSGFICNHSDETGRYAFDQQPGIGQWNLFALAYALQPLFTIAEAKKMLEQFEPVLREEFIRLMAGKLGIDKVVTGDQRLIYDLIHLLQDHSPDYTNTFRNLSSISNAEDRALWLVQFNGDEKAKDWLNRWAERVRDIPDLNARMKQANPKYILRNWVAETAIRAAEDDHDYSLIDQLMTILQNPYDEHPGFEHFAKPPPANMRDLCVSCSS